MERSKLYAKIKEYNLEEQVKNTYCRNFTQVKSNDLQKVINTYEEIKSNKKKAKKFISKGTNDMVKRLVEVLQKKRILLNSEVDYILG